MNAPVEAEWVEIAEKLGPQQAVQRETEVGPGEK